MRFGIKNLYLKYTRAPFVTASRATFLPEEGFLFSYPSAINTTVGVGETTFIYIQIFIHKKGRALLSIFYVSLRILALICDIE